MVKKPKEPEFEEQAKERADIAADLSRVLESPLSVVKMDISELRTFTNRVNDFLKSPGVAAMRICECCITVK